jgi:hypothetical protein
MVTHIKTTIDIADGLMVEAKAAARDDGTTLRALVEEGLRLALERRGGQPAKPFELITYGDPDRPVDPDYWRNAVDAARAGRRFPELGDFEPEFLRTLDSEPGDPDSLGDPDSRGDPDSAGDPRAR